MRVIAGTRRSLPLKTPAGDDTRPTQDRTKETLFNVLQAHVEGAEFLDVFAGSGAISIEALSRGAAHATMIEKAVKALECIKSNLVFTKFTESADVMECDFSVALDRLRGHKPFDIIFMDPPYKAGYEPALFGLLADADYVSSDTIIVLEAALDTDTSCIADNGFEIYKIKKYKTNQHIFIQTI